MKFLSFITALPLDTQIFIGLILLLFLYSFIKYDEKVLTYGPTILTTTGILATFFGIAIGLSNFDTADIQASVPALLKGLKTAFWASVAGVGCALLIKLRHFLFTRVKPEVDGSGIDGEVTASDLAKLLQSIQQALVGSDDSTLVSQLKLLRQDTNNRLDDLKKAQEEALLKLSEMGSKSLVEALRDVIKDFNSKLTEQFGDNFKQLNEAVGRLLVWQEQYKDHIEEMAKRQMEIFDSMSMASDHYSQLVNKADTFTKIATDLSTLLTSLETQKQQLIGALKSLSDLLTAASGSLPEIENKVMELTRQLANSVETNQKEVSKALAENAQLIRTSIQGVGQDLDNINQAFNQHLGELAEKTDKQVLVIGDKVINLTDKLTDSVEANQEEINKALAENTQLIKTSIQEAGKELNSINQAFNQNLGALAEKTNKQVSVIGGSVISLTDQLTSSVEANQKEIGRALIENTQLIRTSIEEVEQDLSRINQKFNQHLGDLAERADKQVLIIGDKVINLTDKLTNAVEANQKEISKALAENVQFIRTSIQGVEQDFAKINQGFNNHLEDLAGKTVKQVSILDAALTEELKKSLESLGRQLAALSEKFVKDYSPLTDKLRDLVSMAKELP